MAQSKIDKYGLGEMAKELARDGHNHSDIAKILTDELRKMSHDDSVNQSTVSRYLKAFREEEEKAAQEAMDVAKETIKAHIENGVDGDLATVEKVQEFFLSITENTLKDKNGHIRELDLKTRMAAGRDVIEVIKAKLQLPGLYNKGDGNDGNGSQPGEGVPPGSNVFNLLDRLEKTVGPGAGLRTAEGGAE